MSYELRLFDDVLLCFDVIENIADPVLHITWVNAEKKDFLPLDLQLSDEGLSHWICRRSVPKNRAYVGAFLSKYGLSINRPMDVIGLCKGLSLNDSYWVAGAGDTAVFSKVNLYDNRFNRILAWTAFTGYGSSVRSSFASSPEFTTNGMLPKCWRRKEGKIYLYKGGTSGASNTGMEPYSELYASQIGQTLGINTIPYHLEKWKGNLCSVCALFTDKDLAYIPIGRLVKKGGMTAVRAFYENLGSEFVQALDEMIVFDALICNTDRHFGNFGVLVDSRKNKIVKPTPLFDHGNSLANYAGKENFESYEKLKAYVETLQPLVYDDFMKEAKAHMNSHLREKLRSAVTFELKTQGRYNYDKKKLKMLTRLLQERAAALLK